MRSAVEVLVHSAEENAGWLRYQAMRLRRGEVALSADDLQARGDDLWRSALGCRVSNDQVEIS